MSFNFSAYYCATGNEQTNEWLNKEFEVTIQTGKKFVRVSDNRFNVPNNKFLQELSVRSGEAIFLAVYAISSVFIYEHWINGARRRGLQHAVQDTMEWFVTGEPESWEDKLIFTPQELEKQLEYIAGHENEHELVNGLQRIWTNRKLENNFPFPLLNEEWLSINIAEYFDITIP